MVVTQWQDPEMKQLMTFSYVTCQNELDFSAVISDMSGSSIPFEHCFWGQRVT